MDDTQKEINYDYGKDVDSLIRIKDRAKIDLVKTKIALLEMGVKTEKDGLLTYLPGLNVQKYSDQGNQEFSWEAEYKDGTIIRQFEGKKQNHYGNIDQSKLKIFRWISAFDFATDNKEKKVIVSLDFETGKFEFLNSFCPQEVRAEIYQGYPGGVNPRLIMKMIKRTSVSQSYPEGKVDEVMYYNRYLIGWESTPDSPTRDKKILCLEPNGKTHFWHLNQ